MSDAGGSGAGEASPRGRNRLLVALFVLAALLVVAGGGYVLYGEFLGDDSSVVVERSREAVSDRGSAGADESDGAAGDDDAEPAASGGEATGSGEREPGSGGKDTAARPAEEPAIVEPPPEEEVFEPEVIGAGSGLIVFSSDRDGDSEVFVMEADGSNVRQLTHNDSYDYAEYWSPNGRPIVFTSERDGDSEVFVMEADGSSVRQLTHNDFYDFAGNMSPDGRRIVFDSDRDGDSEVFVMEADGSSVRQLTHNDSYDYAGYWSPDGRRIVFTSDRDGDDEVFVMEADGSGVRQLTHNNSYDFAGAWSPDGRRILLTSNDGQWWGDESSDSEIFVIDADGSNLRQLTDNDNWDYPVGWSPDGYSIAYHSLDDPNAQVVRFVYVMDADGRNIRQLPFVSDFEAPVAVEEPMAEEEPLVAPVDTTTTTVPVEEAPMALPGEGAPVYMARANWSSGYFQAQVYKQMLEELGYDVSEPSEMELGPSLAYLAMAQGDVDFWANSWYPGHDAWWAPELPDGSRVGDHLIKVGAVFRGGAVQGLLITKSVADEYGITHLDQLNDDPEIRALFDSDGDGRAEFYGCQENWTCDDMMQSMIAFNEWRHIEQIIARYDAMLAEAVAKVEAGEPAVIYTWTPSAYITQLRPGDNVYWLAVENVLDDSNPLGLEGGEEYDQRYWAGTFDPVELDIPAEQCPARADADFCQIGWVPADIQVTANSAWLAANPAAAELLRQAKLSVVDVSLMYAEIQGGRDTEAEIAGLAAQWIADNRRLVDRWIAAALAAA